MKLNQLLIVAALGTQFVSASLAADDTNANGNAELEALQRQVQELGQRIRVLEQERAPQPQTNAEAVQQQIQGLDQQVRILSRQRELDQEAAATAAKAAPRFSLGAGGLNASTADSNFVFSVHGYLQLDSRNFVASGYSPGSDTFVLRRVRPIFAGTVARDFDFLIMPEFGGSSSSSTPSVYDAYLNYHPWSEIQLEAGKFKSPIGLERLQSAKALSFNERSLATDLVPNRDLGVELHGDLFAGRISYAVGLFNGVADGANAANSDFDNDKEFAGRLFFEPAKTTGPAWLQGLGFGVSGGYGSEFGSSGLGSYTTDGQEKFFSYTNGVVADGPHWRLSPQGYYYWGPLSVLGEYVISDQQVSKGSASADVQNTAWEISGGWVLTGEDATYNGVTPRHPFDLKKNQWGAWQVVGRYAELDVDQDAFPVFANPDTSASTARAWSAGLNWWLNRNVRIMTSFSRTTFTGGSSGPVTQQPENVIFTRIQLSF